ncbi:hypothetical protein LHK_00369 [Laribacter hongkongensis HLHK9]|uniref:Uncharacterized protein n=1 Tax=Laribacter hongkongensis (strain HLHK9) TaxID=557598 RepID=C1DBG7_LARHH|nr:hypothetical protein LHK_00369 [Laribacter hongkongensis HLHK9]
MDFLFALVGFFHCGIDHLDHDRRDIDADTVTFDERDDRIVRDRLACNDFLAALRHLDVGRAHACSIWINWNERPGGHGRSRGRV